MENQDKIVTEITTQKGKILGLTEEDFPLRIRNKCLTESDKREYPKNYSVHRSKDLKKIVINNWK